MTSPQRRRWFITVRQTPSLTHLSRAEISVCFYPVLTPPTVTRRDTAAARWSPRRPDLSCQSPQLTNMCRPLSQAPSEYEANPEMLFYRITHLTRGKQYHIWAAAVTTAGRGNISSKVTVEPAGKGGWSLSCCGRSRYF